jgi:hypothetical protein
MAVTGVREMPLVKSLGYNRFISTAFIYQLMASPLQLTAS